MDGHFRAFSFVDRVTTVQPGARIRGSYTIPSGLGEFPTSLVAEAVGQLAAWAAMAAVEFTHRPVAGIAGKVELLSTPRPGQVLELAADLESVDTDTAGYSGAALANGVPIVRLMDCVGPMVPIKDFDEPALVQDRFKLICEVGAVPGGFEGLPPLAQEHLDGEPGQWVRTRLAVPVASPFFADHFPRRPVFPGTLLMHANLQAAARLAAEGPDSRPGTAWLAHSVSDVKLRTFIAPGEMLEIKATVTSRSTDSLHVEVETRNEKALVGSADVQFTRGDLP